MSSPTWATPPAWAGADDRRRQSPEVFHVKLARSFLEAIALAAIMLAVIAAASTVNVAP